MAAPSGLRRQGAPLVNAFLYRFGSLADGSYTVTPSLAGHAFTPASRQVTVAGDDVTAQDFVAVPITHAISGTVSGDVTSGVTVTLDGGAVTTVTDGTGHYGFTALPDGTYTVTPSLSGYTFDPASLVVTMSGADVGGRDFVASLTAGPTYAISGQVTGDVLAGVTLALTGDATAQAVTDGTGHYTFAGLAPGTYRVTPEIGAFLYSPQFRNVTVGATDVTPTPTVRARTGASRSPSPPARAGHSGSPRTAPSGSGPAPWAGW